MGQDTRVLERKRKLRRRVKRALLGLFGLVVVALGLALLALAHLDARPMKGWIQGAAAKQGVVLDFARARVTLGGVRMREVRVASPAADAQLAPALFSVGSIDGRWSLWSRRLDELVIRDVTVTIVRDPDGTTSLDRWLAAMPKAASAAPPSAEAAPPDPLSAMTRSIFPEGIEAHARIEGVTIAIIDRVDGSRGEAGLRRMTLTGMTAKADLASGAAKVTLGPTALKLTVSGAGIAAATAAPGGGASGDGAAGEAAGGAVREAVLDVRGEAQLAAAGHGSVAVEAKLARQTLAPALPPVSQVLSLAATFDFLPAEKRTRFTLEKLLLLDGAAALTAKATVEDVAVTAAQVAAGVSNIRPVLDEAKLRVDLVALARAVPPELGPVEIEGEPLVASVAQAALSPVPQGTLAMSGKLVKARWRDYEVRGLGLIVDARPHPDATGGGAPGAASPTAGAASLLASGVRAEISLPIEQLTMPGLSISQLDAKLLAERRPGALAKPSAAAVASAAPDPLAALWPLELSSAATIAAVTTPTQKAEGISVSARATAHDAASLDAQLTAELARLRGAAILEGVRLAAETKGFSLAPLPLHSTGVVTAKGSVASARDATGIRAKDVRFAAEATLAGAAPMRATATVDAGKLTVPNLGQSLGPSFAGGPLHAELAAPRIELDPLEPARSRGEASFAASYGRATLEGTAQGSSSSVAFTVRAKAPQLGPARGVQLASRGTVAPLALRVEHETDLDVISVATPTAALRGAHLRASSSGTTVQHQGKLSAVLDAVTSGGKSLGSPRFDVTAKVDLARPSVELHLIGKEPASDLRLGATIASGAGGPVVRWQAKGRVGGLAAFAPFLPPGPDWQRLVVDLDGHGAVSGVVRAMRAGTPVLAVDPAATARGAQSLTLAVRELHYRDVELTSADIATMTVKADVTLAAERRAEISVEVPQLAAVSRGVKLGAEALAMQLDARFTPHPRSVEAPPNPLAGVLTAKLSVRARSAKQTAVPWYPLGAPELTLDLSGDVTQKLALAMSLQNPGGGTAVELSGDLERDLGDPSAGVVGRNSLAVSGKLAQRLDGLDASPETLTARGQIEMPFRIESGDLSLFRATAKLKLSDVAIELHKQRLKVAKVRGELPITQEIVLTALGPQLVGQGERGLFSQLRFPDYRPYAGTADYLSIGELTRDGKSYGPVAGNVRVDRDIVAVDQLELLALGGKITGQCIAQLSGKNTQLAFRGKLTGIQPGVPVLVGGAGAQASAAPNGDKLDANVAITIAPYRYALEGRTEIVRIGRAHLLALLDLWDPYRSDIAANRVRLALKVGYPEQVRLHFASGFASLAIDLGGIAGVVRIDEIRGIPIGPALAHWLAPILEQP